MCRWLLLFYFTFPLFLSLKSFHNLLEYHLFSSFCNLHSRVVGRGLNLGDMHLLDPCLSLLILITLDSWLAVTFPTFGLIKLEELTYDVSTVCCKVVFDLEHYLVVAVIGIRLNEHHQWSFLHFTGVSHSSNKLGSIQSENVPPTEFGHELLIVIEFQPCWVELNGTRADVLAVVSKLQCVRQQQNVTKIQVLEHFAVFLVELGNEMVVGKSHLA